MIGIRSFIFLFTFSTCFFPPLWHTACRHIFPSENISTSDSHTLCSTCSSLKSARQPNSFVFSQGGSPGLILRVSTHWSLNPPAELMVLWQLLLPSARPWIAGRCSLPAASNRAVFITVTVHSNQTAYDSVSAVYFSCSMDAEFRIFALFQGCQQLWLTTVLSRILQGSAAHEWNEVANLVAKALVTLMLDLFYFPRYLWPTRSLLSCVYQTEFCFLSKILTNNPKMSTKKQRERILESCYFWQMGQFFSPDHFYSKFH